MIEHEVGYDRFRKLVVAGSRLSVDKGEMAIVAPVEMTQMAQTNAENLDHLLIFRSSYDSSVGSRDAPLEVPAQQLAERSSGRDRIRVGIVVGENQPPAGAGSTSEEALQLGKLLSREITDHRGFDCTPRIVEPLRLEGRIHETLGRKMPSVGG